MERVLPVPHFHVVFTLPGQLRQLVAANARLVFDLLFRCAADTLLQLGEERLGAQLGLTGVLHTWTRDLRLHPHVHFVVTGGGLTRGENPEWVASRPRFLFPIAVMRSLFRGKLLDALGRARTRGKLILPAHLVDDNGWDSLVQSLVAKRWVVYCKRPFAGPKQVFAYLGRYTHRVAVSSTRLVSASKDEVVFRTRGEGRCALHPDQFILRFLQHVLPRAFRKIRHFGLLAPSSVRTRLQQAKALLATAPTAPEVGEVEEVVSDERCDASICPECGGRLLAEPLPTVVEPWDTS